MKLSTLLSRPNPKTTIVLQTLGQRLFERLAYLKIEPNYILDLGCGLGLFSKQLKKRYSKATIISVDLSFLLLKKTKKQQFLTRWPLICSDQSILPFKTGTFDLVFANQLLFSSNQLLKCLNEINRVMNLNGCLMFSTLGPDSLKEFSLVFNHPVSFKDPFIDMHDIGDALMQTKFLDPVMDMEMLTAHYQDLSTLLKSLRVQHIRTVKSSPGLMGRQAWKDFEQKMMMLRTDTNKFSITYEVIYGQAWKGASRQTSIGSETYVPITILNREKGV